MLVRGLAIAFSAIFLGVGPAFAEPNGKVVLALGAGAGAQAMQYTLKLRSADGRAARDVTYIQDHPLANKRDFDGPEENGVVRVISLPPGKWEIAGATMIEWPTEFRPLATFEVPFTVTTGQTAYIGDFRAMTAVANDRGRGLFFEVTNEADRDIPIARRADKKILDVVTAVPDVRAAHTPVFVSADMLKLAAPSAGARGSALCAGAACQPASGDAETFTIETIPSGARVKISSGPECAATPCTITLPRQTPFIASIALPGYQSATAGVDVADFGGAGASQHVSLFGALGAIGDVATGRSRELTPNPLLVVLEPAAAN